MAIEINSSPSKYMANCSAPTIRKMARKPIEQKISKELKQRSKLLDDYKSVVSNFNSKFKSYENDNLYFQIKKK